MFSGLRKRLSRRRSRRGTGPRTAEVQVLEQRALLAVTFRFDYRYDSAGFFGEEERTALERAGQMVSSRLGDTLSAIVPGGGNTWEADFVDPATGNQTSLSNLTIAADEILVFAGARNLGSVLAQGGWGGTSITGSAQWIDTVLYRGEASNGTDFAPWGGTLTFSTTRSWHIGSTVEGLESGEFDLTSLAAHELMHVLGFSNENDSYDRWVTGSTFRGSRSIAEYDGTGNVPLDAGLSHWVNGTTDEGQPTLMAPSFSSGQRKLPTPLDWAGLHDIGWEADLSTRDYGDATPGTYPTLESDNGAWHNIKPGLFLGMTADPDADGQASDDDDEFDDEDGVVLPAVLSVGASSQITVAANRAGMLNAWIDLNQDGDWADAGEQIITNQSLAAGENELTVTVPADATAGTTWARFRLNSGGGLGPTGGASDGEVEDYEVQIAGDVAAIDDAASVAAGASVDIDVVANDLPTGRIHVLDFQQPTQGAVTLTGDGQLRFTAGAGDSGVTTFSYTAALVQQQLAGSTAGAEFGRVVALSGDTLIVGAALDPDPAGTGSGTVHVYRRDGFDFNHSQTITAPDIAAGDRFGFSVAIDENTLVIGSKSDDDSGLNSGSVYVFTRALESSAFSFSQKLLASTGKAKDQFGFSVAVDGDTLAVGVRMDDQGGTNSGSVEVFDRPGPSSDFVFTQRVQPEPVEAGDQFGASVALSGDRLFVGARKDSGEKTNSGAVYVLTRSGGPWSHSTTILPGKPENSGYFGHSLAVENDRLVVGQPARQRPSRTGRVYVHGEDTGGADNWGLVTRIDGDSASGGNRFGWSVSIEGGRFAAGSPRMHNGQSTSGLVVVHARDEGGADNWGEVRTVIADNAGGGDEAGYGVVISGDRLFFGARREDSGGLNAGSVYFEDLRTDVADVTVTIGP